MPPVSPVTPVTPQRGSGAWDRSATAGTCRSAPVALREGRRTYDAPVLAPTRSVAEPAPTDVGTLPPRARRVRLAATAVVLALLLGGTVWGEDSEFPFGPFRMYSTRADPNQPVVSTSVVGVTADGDELRMSGGETGLRRAEFEGQLPRLAERPELLGLLAETYARDHPGAEELVAVRIVQRRFELRDGRRTGTYTDSVLIEHPLSDADPEGTP